MILHINVTDKIATYQKRDGDIVCGNSDYQIQFIFDSEWDAHGAKKARVIYNGQYIDLPIEDNVCTLPVIRNTDSIQVGVYTSDGILHTTTPAYIKCHKSILCGTEKLESAPENDMNYVDEAGKAAIRAEAAATRAETLVGDAEEAINNCENVAEELIQAKENGVFDGHEFVWCGEFDESIDYKVDDVVEYNGSVYICIQDKDNNQDPINYPDYWQLFVSKGADGKDGTNGVDGADGRSLNWCGEFDENEAYKVDDVVEYNGSTYICIQDKSNDQAPITHPDYWQLFTEKGKDGIGLPAVTTADNGKIIEVVNGAYVLKDLADSSVKTYIDEYINTALGGDY